MAPRFCCGSAQVSLSLSATENVARTKDVNYHRNFANHGSPKFNPQACHIRLVLTLYRRRYFVTPAEHWRTPGFRIEVRLQQKRQWHAEGEENNQRSTA